MWHKKRKTKTMHTEDSGAKILESQRGRAGDGVVVGANDRCLIPLFNIIKADRGVGGSPKT